MMLRMVVVMARVIVLVALCSTNSRRCASAVVAFGVKDILVLDSLGLPALLRVHAL
jgi:hypothetical protein